MSKFWQVVLGRSAVTKLLPQVYVSQDVLPKPKKIGEIQVNMQTIIQNAGSFSGLVIDLKKILDIERWTKAWIKLFLLSYGLYEIILTIIWIVCNQECMVLNEKINVLVQRLPFIESGTFLLRCHIILCLYYRNISMLIIRLFC